MSQEELIRSPNPGPQTEVLTRLEKEILYGGARGGGKTDAGISWLLYFIDNPKLRCLVLRYTYEDLVDWIDRADQLYSEFGAVKTGKPVIFKFPSGAEIRTGYLKGQSFDKYKGHEYQKMIIEELTQIPGEDGYEKLLGSLRSTADGLDPQIFLTTNPDGIGRLRVKRRFVDITIPGTPYTDEKGNTRIFISAKIQDNPILISKDPGYVNYLEGIQDDQLRKAWLEGDWEAYDVKGAIYSEQLKQLRSESRVCKLPAEKDIAVHTSWDIGLDDSTSITMFQIIGKEIRIIDSYTNRQEFASHYVSELNNKGYLFGYHFLPHDANIRSKGDGKTYVDYLNDYGLQGKIHVLKRPTDLWLDIGLVRQKFAYCWFDREKAQTLVEHLELYRQERDSKYNQFKNEPVHGPESHYADSFRYAIFGYIFLQTNGNIQLPIRKGEYSSITGKQILQQKQGEIYRPKPKGMTRALNRNMIR